MPRTRREWKIFPINVRELTIARIDDFAPGFRRITLTGDQLGAFTTPDGIEVPPLRNDGFDDHVKIIVPGFGEETARPPRQVEGHLDWSDTSPAKDYTPRRWDAAAGELDLDFVRHGTGFASTWVERVQVGDSAFIAGPKNSLLLPPEVDWLLLAGDETALPAIGRLLEEWPDGVRGQVFCEVADAEHELGFVAPDGVEVTWLHRDGAAPGTSDVLEKAIRSADWWSGTVYCWLAGETMTLKPIRTHLKIEREVPPDCLEVTGYWRRTETRVDEVAALQGRIDTLYDLTTPVVLRTAIAAGVIGRLEKGPASVPALAGELGLHEPTLRALIRYLATHEIFALPEDDVALVGTAPVRLGALGEFLLHDDEEYDDPARTFFDLTPDALLTTLRTGDPVPRPGGDPLPDPVVRHLEFEASWWAPSVVIHHDWSGYSAVSIRGTAAGALRSSLADTQPQLATSLGGPVVPNGAIVLMNELQHLDDAAAHDVLAELAGEAGAHGVPLLVVETVLETDEEVHDHDAEADLQLRVAFGSGRRTVEEVGALLAAAGFSAQGAAMDLGWDNRLWVLAPR